ncbi:MAG TPA: hypothetical protein VND90_06995 [Terracidiphilus sp.]|jgi:multisubunit Na+/H+ antiporter MnhG subunit|nr:hypothetical protein [Terracidiphilus sp.]
MNLDLRIPMGMMFSMAGAVLLAFGVATRNRPDLYTRSFGMNPDVWWGVVVLVFGLIVVGLGRRGQGRIELQKQRAKK